MAITKRVLAQRAVKEAAEQKAEQDTAFLESFGLKVGDLIRVEGDRSVFKVFGVGPDQSVTCVDQGQSKFRSFRAEWVFPAFRTNRAGRLVKLSVPAEIKGLRDAWRAERGVGGPR
ncbi:MAG: hypothetical protein WKF57_06100 [Nakamurella sp.]